MNNEQKAQSLPSASLVQNGVLSAALSVEDGNKLIGEFMNHPFIKKWKRYNYKGEFPYKDLKYHTSWDWMMPALDKFINKSTRPIESRDLNEYRNYCNRLYNLVTDFNIRDVFNCLVEAIKWLRSVGSR